MSVQHLPMPDDRPRCWPMSDPLYFSYHDEEWGRPVTDERGLLEKMCLEGFQSGLSWLTVLRKRPAFREAFANFEADKLALFRERDVERLLGNATIIRHRGKIEAAIANAQATVALREAGGSLVQLLWSHRPVKVPVPKTLREMQVSTPETAALSKELKRRGFRFVGPTTLHSLMQACGLVNEHLATCFVRDEVERERLAALKALAL
jgi:DNA-3-methyladenine glycosylase I